MALNKRKQILLELLQLEGEDLGDLGKTDYTGEEKKVEESVTINAAEEKTPLTKPKKQLSAKQIETLKKGQEVRDANRAKRAEEKRIKEEEEKKKMEEKLVKKAIALKKKQLKKQQILDEISSEDEPELKAESKRVPLEKPAKPVEPKVEPVKMTPVIKFY